MTSITDTEEAGERGILMRRITWQRVLAVVCIVSMMAAVGCGKESSKAVSILEEEEAPLDTHVTLSDAESVKKDEKTMAVIGSVNIDGVGISLNGDMAPIKEHFGEPVKYSESKSCLYDGYDKVYEYDGFKIVTYPDKKGEKVSSISYTLEDITAFHGLAVGDSYERVAAYFGENAVTVNKRCCVVDEMAYGYCFYYDGDSGKITEIEMYIITE